MQIALVSKPGQPNTGVGRYVRMLEAGLRQAGLAVTPVAPVVPPLPAIVYAGLRRAGIDARAFLLNFPIWAAYPPADIYHISSQNLASLLMIRRPPGRTVVTVHDILPFMLRRHPALSIYRTPADRLFDRLAMRGLRRADLLIADSWYTRRCLEMHLGVKPEKIRVVHLGIDHQRFRPAAVASDLRQRYNLPADRRYLIYVGSEDPRKNLPALVRALAEARHDHSNIELIKVGRAHFEQQRSRLRQLAADLGVAAAVHFLDDVPEDDLPALYSLADIAVQPSLYEGFGFPALEAMACGTPVICARAASLPELAGQASLLVETGPTMVSGLAAAIGRLLDDHVLAADLGKRGYQQARTFTWNHTAQQVLDCYHELAPGRIPASAALKT